jgi:UDP-perosamine 4-acetyltransferase
VKRIVIIGAGRQGRNVAEVFAAQAPPPAVAGFLDDTKARHETVIGVPVLGGFDRLDDEAFLADHAWFVAIGDNRVRQRLGKRLAEAGAEITNAIHPFTTISSFARIGRGVFIAAFSRVGSNSLVEDWVLIEANAHIGCDVVVGNSAFVGPGGILAGGSSVGALSFIGSNAVISNTISVGDECTIGANAVVVRDVPQRSRAQGVPARLVALGTRR